MIIGDFSSFNYWVKNSPKFVLEQSQWCARIIRDWVEAYGQETAARMIAENVWVEPANTLFGEAFGEDWS